MAGLGMTGASYLGFTQWALARDAGPMLKALFDPGQQFGISQRDVSRRVIQSGDFSSVDADHRQLQRL